MQCWWDQALVQPLGNSAEGPQDPEGMAAVRLGYHFWVFVLFLKTWLPNYHSFTSVMFCRKCSNSS